MIGTLRNHTFSFSQEDVILFAKCTGDNNPVHLDEEYAGKTIFKTRILHGFLSASVFSKIFGTIDPGEGTLYLSQTMFFLKPMFADVSYTAKTVLMEIDQEKGRAKYTTEIFDPAEVLTFRGEAIVFNLIFKKNNE